MIEFQYLTLSTPNNPIWSGPASSLRAKMCRIPRMGNCIGKQTVSLGTGYHSQCDVGLKLVNETSRLIDTVKGHHLPQL